MFFSTLLHPSALYGTSVGKGLKRKVLFLRKWLAWRDTFEPRLEKLHDELRVAARRDEEG